MKKIKQETIINERFERLLETNSTLVCFYDALENKILGISVMTAVPRIDENVAVKEKQQVGKVVGIRWQIPEMSQDVQKDDFKSIVNSADVYLQFD